MDIPFMYTPSPLTKRQLGNTHMNVTAMSLGSAGLGGIFGSVSDKDGIEAVELALELGMNWIDTSPFYGEAERRIGIALKGVPRDKYYISSKVGTHPLRSGDYSASAANWTVENSLKVLGVDYLDICLVHDPKPENLQEALSQDGALEALIQMKSQGMIRSIGIGVQDHNLIRRAIDTGHIDMVLSVNDYSLLRQSAIDGVCKYAELGGIGVVNGAALAMGLLSGRDPLSIGTAKWTPPANEVASAIQVTDWCKRRGVSVLGLALQFSLRQPRLGCTLIGASSAKEVKGCWDAVTTEIPESVWEQLPELIENVQVPQPETA